MSDPFAELLKEHNDAVNNIITEHLKTTVILSILLFFMGVFVGCFLSLLWVGA